MGCAYFDANDIANPNRNAYARLIPSCHQGPDVFKDFDKTLGTYSWSDASGLSDKEKVFELLNETLDLIQKINKERPLPNNSDEDEDENVQDSKNINENDGEAVKEDKPGKLAKIPINFGCTFDPEKRETLPHSQRKLIAIQKFQACVNYGLVDGIYNDQARFIDSSLFLLFGALLRRSDDVPQNDAMEIDATENDTLESDAMEIDTAENDETENEPIKMNFILKGMACDEEAEGCSMIDWRYQRHGINLREIPAKIYNLYDEENQRRAGKVKSQTLKDLLPATKTELIRTVRPFVKTITWLDLPDVGFNTLETQFVSRRIHPGTHSLWYSRLMKILYTPDPDSVDTYIPKFRTAPQYPDLAHTWNLINYLPWTQLSRLELTGFRLAEPWTIGLIVYDCGIQSLNLNRGLLLKGSWREVLDVFYHSPLRFLKVDELHQDDYEYDEVLRYEVGYSSSGTWVASDQEAGTETLQYVLKELFDHFRVQPADPHRTRPMLGMKALAAFPNLDEMNSETG